MSRNKRGNQGKSLRNETQSKLQRTNNPRPRFIPTCNIMHAEPYNPSFDGDDQDQDEGEDQGEDQDDQDDQDQIEGEDQDDQDQDD